MNLIIYIKHLGKILVLNSYNEPKTRTAIANKYYTMVISTNGKVVYVSSEEDHDEVAQNGTQFNTQNHTLYIIDEKTGEITEYYLGDLEKAVNDSNNKQDKKECAQCKSISERNKHQVESDGEDDSQSESQEESLDQEEAA